MADLEKIDDPSKPKEPLDDEKQYGLPSSTRPALLKDGIRLHPQPTSDPLDPLNWSSWKKNSILAIVMAL